jgi:hypothetical protein
MSGLPPVCTESERYRFLLAMLIDRGVLRKHDRVRQPDGSIGPGWGLHGIYGVDDSGEYRGWSHLGPENAIDSAIAALREYEAAFPSPAP